jgi:hypothetical protein
MILDTVTKIQSIHLNGYFLQLSFGCHMDWDPSLTNHPYRLQLYGVEFNFHRG